jgi:hypothetical protein
MNLPKALKSAGLSQYTGRENTLTGVMLTGLHITSSQLQVVTYNNGDPISANGASAEIDGWFTAVRP